MKFFYNYKWFIFVFFLTFPSSSFAEDYLKNIMTSLEIALTNESTKESHVEMDVIFDDKPLIKDFYFEYHHNPITDTPDKRYHYTVAIGKHVMIVTAKNGKHVFSFPVIISKKGLYIDLRYQDGESLKKQNNYDDGRIRIQEGRFEVIMAPPGIIGYD